MRWTNSANNSHWHLCDIHATLSQPISPFHGNPPFDTGNVICPMGCSPNLETSFTLSPPCTSRSSIPHPTHFRSAQQTTIIPNQVVLHTYTQHTHTHTHTQTHTHTHKRDILKQVPSFLHKDHWMHQATCPHSTNQLLRYSAKEHPATLYGISASSFKYWSSCNILPFCNYTSSPALLQYPQYSLIIFSTA